MSTHDEIVAAMESYLENHAKFEEKDVKAACPRARKALGDLAKLAKVRRAELQERKNAMDGAKALEEAKPAAKGKGK